MNRLNVEFFKENLSGDMITKSKGIFTVREGFYYTHGKTASNLKDKIEKQLQELNVKYEIVDSGEIWKPFKGGAELRNQSHWFVKFKAID